MRIKSRFTNINQENFIANKIKSELNGDYPRLTEKIVVANKINREFKPSRIK